MQKNLLFGISVVAACVVVFASYSNVVGVQLVKASNDRVINDALDQKEILFQTIVDIANNKEILRVILGSELTGKRFVNPDMNFIVFNPPVVTEKFLKLVYTMAVVLSRTLSTSRIHTPLERYQIHDQSVRKKLVAVIENDTVLKTEVAKLSDLSCDCENGNVGTWYPSIICTVLDFLQTFLAFLSDFFGYAIFWLVLFPLIFIDQIIYEALHCP